MYPNHYVIDHMTLRTDVRKRLDRIRIGQLNLGQSPPEASAIQGGKLWPPPSSVMGCPGAIFANNQTGKWGGVF
jgi:hypothetical protein